MNSSTTASGATGTLASIAAETEVLIECYPNPFNDETVISYQLTEPSEVSFGVFDILGRQITWFDQGLQSDGSHEIRWTPENLSAGVYVAVLRMGNQIHKQMLLYMK
jgi:hypothetical protein